MKNRLAGVTLDWYDDRGETLKKVFPTLDSVPEVIKTAGVRPKERLNHEDFALVALDEGTVHHKYACNDAGTTAMSVIYFMEHGDKLPEEAQKVAAASLVEACQRFDLTPPAAMMKVAKLPSVLRQVVFGGKIPQWSGAEFLLQSPEKRYIIDRTRAALIGQAAGSPAIRAKMPYNPTMEEVAKGGKWHKLRAKEQLSRIPIKKASVIDITGKSPRPKIKVATPMNDSDYAVVLNGQRLYPINTWDLVKKAEQYFRNEQIRMAPEIRRQFAVKLAAKAKQLGYPIQENIKEAGAQTRAPNGHLRAAIEMRKVACAPGEGRQFLDGLLKQSSALDPNVYAECLRRFDVQNGLDRGWDRVIPNPWDSTFGIDKTAEVIWEQGADRLTREQLINLSENHTSGIQELFSHDFLKEFIKDPIAMFESLPLPNKRVMARLADNMSHAGQSEGASVTNEAMRM